MASILRKGELMEDKIIEFKCEIEREVYNSSDFKIYGVYVDTKKYPDVQLNQYGNATVVGNLHDLALGIEYSVRAKEKSNNKFGLQYEVINIKRGVPNNVVETGKFLSEILTDNQVDVLLEAYPDIVQRIMNNHKVDLSKTKGIKEKTFEIIKRKIVENFALVDLIEKYSNYGITISMLKKLYDKYPSIEKLEEELITNPYESLCSISGIGFKKADSIVLSLPKKLLQIDSDIKSSRQRMTACMMFALLENENEGNTKMDIIDFRKKCIELTPECINHFVDIIKNDLNIHFNAESKIVATKVAYETERYIASVIKQMLKNPRRYNFDYRIYKEQDDMELTDLQLNVLKNLCDYNISLLSGFAGSGKSATTKSVIKMLDDNNLTYLLVTPTGKSSKVLANYTGREASTIHRGLGYNPEQGWAFNEGSKLDVDVVICDETGMVDIYLMKHLLEAVDINKTKILFIQDPAQIPSVSCGNCSSDMLDSGIIPSSHLDKIFRYAEGGLYNVATNIRYGKNYIPKTDKTVVNFGINSDYSLITIPQENSVDAIVNLYEKLLKDGATINDIMVLSHHNKGDYGSKIINQAIQSKINPPKKDNSIKHGDITFTVGDKVLQVVNNYKATDIFDNEKQVFNGNTGIIKYLNNDDLVIDFDGEQLIYGKDELGQLLLGYAMSIHKSQGDSSKYVIVNTPKAHTYFINRNLLYTAVTRTREKCFHISEKELIKSSLKKSITNERQTFLKDLLIETNKQL